MARNSVVSSTVDTLPRLPSPYQIWPSHSISRPQLLAELRLKGFLELADQLESSSSIQTSMDHHLITVSDQRGQKKLVIDEGAAIVQIYPQSEVEPSFRFNWVGGKLKKFSDVEKGAKKATASNVNAKAMVGYGLLLLIPMLLTKFFLRKAPKVLKAKASDSIPWF